jgi:hypothetical protein
MKPLDFVYVIAILSAVVAAPFILIGWSNYLGRRSEERVFPLKSTLFFAVPVLVGLLAAGISTSIAQSEVAEFLSSVSDRHTISIEGRLSQNRQQVLDTLKQVTNLPAHHSSPTRELHVDISDPPRHLQLSVARDSSDPHEYWVFAPSPSKLASRAAMKKDIGHIRTAVFDEY